MIGIQIPALSDTLQSLPQYNSTTSRTLNLPVILTGSDGVPRAYIATNISFSRISTNSDSATFRIGEILQLKFSANFDGCSKHCLVFGKFRGITENAFAIDFYRMNNETFGFIKKLMFDIDLREMWRKKYSPTCGNR